MTSKRTRYSLIATLLLAFIVPVTQSQAACWCGIEYCIGWTDPLQVDDSKTRFDTVPENPSNSGPLYNKDCKPGRTPDKHKCTAAGTTAVTYAWQVTGTLHYSYFNVSAQASTQTTFTAGPICETEISSWCSCCHTRVWRNYKYTYKEGLCWCISPFCIFGSTYSATNREFVGFDCEKIEERCNEIVPDDCDAGPCDGA